MAVTISVTWRVLDHPGLEFTYRFGEVAVEAGEEGRCEPQVHSPEEVLELGSSTLAPGLSMQVA